MLRTAFVAAIAVLACVLPGEAQATRAEDEATDRMTEGVLSIPHDSIPASAIAVGSGQFMLPNSGNLIALVIGCEANCRGLRVQVRAAGLAPIEARAPEDNPTFVALHLPEAYRNSLSNFEVSITARCAFGEECANRWGALARGVARLNAPPLSAAEWNGGGELVRLSNLRWRQRPTAEDLRFYYPVNAWRSSTSGSARLECIVVTGGALRCRAAGESPANGGFGESARRLSTHLRVEETGEDGASLIGRRVVVPIRFQPAGS
jgi:hypothetical protein